VEDLDDFFDEEEFANEAQWSGTTVLGIFDTEYAEIMGVEGIRPVFLCRASLVASAAHGDAITIAGITYHIVGKHPDGTGLIHLILEQQ
jgi:hypothetical protein